MSLGIDSLSVDSPFGSPYTRPSTPGTDIDDVFDVPELPPAAEFMDTRPYILVTGGLGFIGSHTTLELLKTGYNVIVVDDLSNSFRSVYDKILMAAKIHYTRHHSETGKQCPELKHWEVDYRNQPAMRGLLNTHSPAPERSYINGVIHFAAFKAVEDSIKNPLKYYRNNVSGLVDFLGLLEEFNIKNFIFSSSATVYGAVANEGKALVEEDCVHKPETYTDANGAAHAGRQGCTGITNPYGRTKYFGEAVLSDVAQSDPLWNITALRYFNPIGCDSSGILGEDPRGTPSNLVPVVVKVMTGQFSELSVFGSDWDTPDGTAVRDFIHVSDLARGHIAALENLMPKTTTTVARTPSPQPNKNFNTYNLGSGEGHSVTEIVETMENVTGTKIVKKMVGRREGDVGSCVADVHRATAELNWQTEKTLEDACVDICNFLQRNQ